MNEEITKDITEVMVKAILNIKSLKAIQNFQHGLFILHQIFIRTCLKKTKR